MPLRLVHAEQHAPTYRTITEDDHLYDMAAWAFHHADELPLRARAAFMAALAQVWPRNYGRRRGVRGKGRDNPGTRRKAQWAHYWMHVLKPDLAAVCVLAHSIGWSDAEITHMLSQWRTEASAGVPREYAAGFAAERLGLSVDRVEKLAREHAPDAEREQHHAEAEGCDDYGLPRVERACPDRDSPDDVPDSSLLRPGWHGQMMLSDDAGRYRLANLARADQLAALRWLRERRRARSL